LTAARARIELWRDLSDLFEEDDGSLPEIQRAVDRYLTSRI
jgi:hypothetical protein